MQFSWNHKIFLFCYCIVACTLCAGGALAQTSVGTSFSVTGTLTPAGKTLSDGTVILQGSIQSFQSGSSSSLGVSGESSQHIRQGFWQTAAHIIAGQEFGSVVVLPEIEGAIGDTIQIPLLLEKSKNLAFTKAREFEAVIRYNGTILQSIGNTPSCSFPSELGGDTCEIVIRGTADNLSPDDTRVLTSMDFLVKLGSVEQTALHITSFQWLDAPEVKVIRKHGAFQVNGICYEHGTARLVFSRTAGGIFSVVPQPIVATADITVGIREQGLTEIYVVDIRGKRVLTILEEVIPTGRMTFPFSADLLESGMYFLILKTPNQLFTKQIIIEK
jgi:hypothetical protein